MPVKISLYRNFTEWDEFKEIDYKSVYQSMMKPAILFDGRNLLDLEMMVL